MYREFAKIVEVDSKSSSTGTQAIRIPFDNVCPHLIFFWKDLICDVLHGHKCALC